MLLCVARVTAQKSTLRGLVLFAKCFETRGLWLTDALGNFHSVTQRFPPPLCIFLAAARTVGPCEPRALRNCNIPQTQVIIFGSISIDLIYAWDLKVTFQDNTVDLGAVLPLKWAKTQSSKTDFSLVMFCNSLCGLRGVGTYPTSEGEGGVLPGQAASLLQGQHRVTNKHPHSHTYTYWQFGAANQPKTHVLRTVGESRKTRRDHAGPTKRGPVWNQVWKEKKRKKKELTSTPECRSCGSRLLACLSVQTSPSASALPLRSYINKWQTAAGIHRSMLKSHFGKTKQCTKKKNQKGAHINSNGLFILLFARRFFLNVFFLLNVDWKL